MSDNKLQTKAFKAISALDIMFLMSTTENAPKKNRSTNAVHNKQIMNVSDWLLISLNEFYKNPKHRNIILPIIEGTSDSVSLRLIDWFVTNYSKKYGTIIENQECKYISVYNSYRSQLKWYTKKRFDPFRRSVKFEICFPNVKFQTTIGQLNFFKWLITNNILSFIKDNKDLIEGDMIQTQKENMLVKRQDNQECIDSVDNDKAPLSNHDAINKNQIRKKRNKLSQNTIGNMTTYLGNHTLKFD